METESINGTSGQYDAVGKNVIDISIQTTLDLIKKYSLFQKRNYAKCLINFSGFMLLLFSIN